MIKKIIRLYLFWLLFFLVFRIIFIAYEQSNTQNASLTDCFLIILNSFRLDLSTASYCIILPFLLYSVQLIRDSNFINKAISVYHYILIAIAVVLLLADLPLYKSWGTHLNRRALSFLADPAEMMASLTNLMLLTSILALVILYSGAVILFKKITVEKNVSANKFKLLQWLLSAGLIFLLLRGGWQLIPVNESAARFSTNQFHNDAAVNPLWHLIDNLNKTGLSDKNPYAEFTDQEAEKIVSALNNTASCRLSILNNTHPNIVILLLESFTADIIGPLKGDSTVTPFLSSLSDSSLLFTDIYASGRRTDQALPSVFSGFPAQPFQSVMRFSDKAAALPSLPRTLKANGYELSFYYGGETGFSNMGAFLLMNGFEKIISRDDFPSGEMNSKWGAHDEFVLNKQVKDLADAKQPFLSVLLTLTSHEPFEVPRKNYFPLKGEAGRFKNAARYTDECLKEYFQKARQQSWYENTLYIIVADHGHRLPLERDFLDVRCHHIPLLICGGALKDGWKGKTIGITGAQHDIPATILHQLGMDFKSLWSNDLLDTCRKSYAYTDMDDYAGWVTPQGSYIYKQFSNHTEMIKGTPDTSLRLPAAYRQMIFRQFMDLDNRSGNK